MGQNCFKCGWYVSFSDGECYNCMFNEMGKNHLSNAELKRLEKEIKKPLKKKKRNVAGPKRNRGH